MCMGRRLKGLDLFSVTPQGIDPVAANACKKGVTTSVFVYLATYVHGPAEKGMDLSP